MRIDGFLKQISVGDENNVWGVNSKDEVFYRRDNIWVQGMIIFYFIIFYIFIYLFTYLSFNSSW